VIYLWVFDVVINSRRLTKSFLIIKPGIILKFHKALTERKYHLLFSNKSTTKPGPKGPSQEIIDLVVEMKRGNSQFGYRRIAMRISNAFNIQIDKDVVCRILENIRDDKFKNDGPSWLSFIGNMKDSLWFNNYHWKKHCNEIYDLPIAT